MSDSEKYQQIEMLLHQALVLLNETKKPQQRVSKKTPAELAAIKAKIFKGYTHKKAI